MNEVIDLGLLHNDLSVALQQPLWTMAAFSVSYLYKVVRTAWMGDRPIARLLPTHRKNRTQTSMPRVGFEPMIPVFERAKTVHDLLLNCSATVIGIT
jgi:hypothetical protein